MQPNSNIAIEQLELDIYVENNSVDMLKPFLCSNQISRFDKYSFKFDKESMTLRFQRDEEKGVPISSSLLLSEADLCIFY